MAINRMKSVSGRLLSASALSVVAAMTFNSASQAADQIGLDWQLGHKVVGGVAVGRVAAFDRAAITAYDPMQAYERGHLTKAELLAEHPEFDKPGMFTDRNVGGAARGGLIPVAFERGALTLEPTGAIKNVDMAGTLTLDNGETHQLANIDGMDAYQVGERVAIVGTDDGRGVQAIKLTQ